MVSKIPAWSLDYLINGETSGLTNDDLILVKKWEASLKGPIAISMNGEPYFSSCPAFSLPCDVYDCDVLIG